MGRASLKHTLRHVRRTSGRFAAIAAITALGVAILSGLKATAPAMRSTAQGYFAESGFMDFRLVSTAGITREDAEAVREVRGVKAVSPGYSADAAVKTQGADLVVRLVSLDGSGINRPKLVEGRMPENARECLADPRFLSQSALGVGSRVTLAPAGSDGKDGILAEDVFTITGTAWCPLYISIDRGSSAYGTGAVNAYLLLAREAFALDVYTDLYLTVENPGGLSRFDEGYAGLLEPVGSALEALGKERAAIRYQDLMEEGAAKLSDARTELAGGERELADAAAKLQDARAQIKDGEAELTKAEEDFRRGIAEARAELAESTRKYTDGVTLYRESRARLRQARERCAANLALLEAAKAAAGLAGKSTEEMAVLLAQAEAQLALLPPGSPQTLALAAQAAALRQLLEGHREAEAAQKALLHGGRRLTQVKIELDNAKVKLDKGRGELVDAETGGLTELNEQRAKLEDARQELADAEREYEEQRAEALPKLADARQAVAEGEEALAGLKRPEWYVLDAGKNQGFAGFRQDTERVEAVGVVFPLIFFLVAALVSLTMMTRLVEDDRTLNGTLKALGYSPGYLAARYLLYAAAASLAGSAVGLAAGVNLFPRVIFHAYRILYTLPDVAPSLQAGPALASSAAALASAALPAWSVCAKSLQAGPAALMLPKSPQAGRRILLERFGPLWRRMKFTQKVTARNLFRYKKRLFMTVAGVAGCTALLLTGFGLKDSIAGIVDRQFGRVRTFDIVADLKDDMANEEATALAAVLRDPAVRGSLLVRQQPVDAGNTDGAVMGAYLVVPEQPDEMGPFLHLLDPADGRSLQLGGDGSVLTQKLAEKLGVGPGGAVTLRDKGGSLVTVNVSGVAENYIYHYIYLSPALYERLYGSPPAYNQVLLHAAAWDQDPVAEDLLRQNAVLSVTKVSKLRENVHKMLSALNAVVLVMILSAAALAFVVLFSLSSINIDERKHELATLKVLGFTPRELAAYVFRENTALTAIGTAAGLALGVPLERYVILTAEVELVAFARDISLVSFALSALLSFAFSAAVNAAMALKLKGVDMASTLKGGE